jgi:hypothetical protein
MKQILIWEIMYSVGTVEEVLHEEMGEAVF